MLVSLFLATFLATTLSESSRYHIDVTASCCSRADNATDLMQCIDDLEPPEVADDLSRMAILSYASPDIIPYAAYSFAVNSAYAEHNGYEIFFMSPETGSNHEPRDQRWNRVKIIMDALDATDGWLRDVDYVVWADADLIFLDMELNLRQLTEEHPDADIIISAERHAETGVANTGCFIMKNSQWSRDFLRDWWVSFDRTLNHDQIFFDVLYKRRLPGVASHVKILPADAINSMPPPTIHQKAHNQVLHMMGQQLALRQRVFRLGLEEICRAFEEGDDMAPQLGLTQPRLYSMALQRFETELSRIVSILEDQEQVAKLSVEEFSQLTGEAREHMLQIQIYSPTQDNADIAYVLYNAAKTRALHAEAVGGKEQLKYMPSLYNSWAVYGNDLATTIPVPAERMLLLLEVEGVLHKLYDVVSVGQRHIATEMLLRLYSQMGSTELTEKHFDKAIGHFQKSLQLLEEMGDNRNNVYAVEALMNMGSALCMTADIRAAVETFMDAMELQEGMLFAEQQMKQDHIQLATILLRTAGCMAKGGLLEDALIFSTRAHEILSVHPEKDSTAPLLEAWERIDQRIRDELSQSADKNEFMLDLASRGAKVYIDEMRVSKKDSQTKRNSGVRGSASPSVPRKKKMMRRKKSISPDL